MTRVAVVDVGTNSTRLLVAEVADGRVEALDRRSIVTRLGEGLEAAGALGEAPMARVLRVLDEYTAAMEEQDVSIRVGVLTSAVRDASNGAEFLARIREDYGIDAATISGDEEARLTFAGATAGRDGTGVLVVDIGGGSTELVSADWHVSTQVGVVRHTERHGEDVEALRADAGATIRDALQSRAGGVEFVVAVAGTATMAASMELELEPYDPERVEGYELSVDQLRARLEALRALEPEARRDIPGLHPDRAPTIVAGIAILIEVLEAVGTGAVEVSDRDILYGAALNSGS